MACDDKCHIGSDLFPLCLTFVDMEGAMVNAVHAERPLRDVEADIFRGECLVGRMAALAAISSARGRPHQTGEARRMLAAVAEVLEPLYAIRNALRHPA